jgi:hypothetical protein
MKLIWYISALMVVSILLVNWQYVDMHEHAHVQIDKYFGCKNVTVVYEDFGFSGYTIPRGCDPAQNRDRKMMSSMNEIVGYHMIILFNILLFIAFIAMLVYMMYKGDGKRATS